MVAFENALLLLVLLTALSVIGRRLPWPMPITYVVGATLAATLLRFPRVELDPGFFFRGGDTLAAHSVCGLSAGGRVADFEYSRGRLSRALLGLA